jgi:hypothetical protein
MAAQQPPPNWVAFSAASRRVSQSTTQIVQALQASANIPADIATMSSELEQLEHQPTNATTIHCAVSSLIRNFKE